MAVTAAMVGCERCRHHPPNGNFAANSPGPLDRHTKADECDLRRVDNAEYSLDAALSEIGHRDRRIGELGAAQCAAARAGNEISQLDHQLIKRKPIDIMDGRRDEAAAA